VKAHSFHFLCKSYVFLAPEPLHSLFFRVNVNNIR